MTRSEKIAAHKANKATHKLPENVAKNYEAPHGAMVIHIQKPVKRTIDLRKISASQAKELAEDETFRFLVRKESVTNQSNEPKK